MKLGCATVLLDVSDSANVLAGAWGILVVDTSIVDCMHRQQHLRIRVVMVVYSTEHGYFFGSLQGARELSCGMTDASVKNSVLRE